VISSSASLVVTAPWPLQPSGACVESIPVIPQRVGAFDRDVTVDFELQSSRRSIGAAPLAQIELVDESIDH
jgi:hypothetical protein